jgi:3'(2'), 5'-bisphosphate nucleotidase
MKVSEQQLETLCQIANAAGQEIMAVYSQNFASWQKDDRSPLTEADLRADRVIRKELETHFPDVFIRSEESDSITEASGDTFFLVDPLDGTKEFLKRNDEFTVNIALVHQGRVAAGVVLAPALGELFFAAEDQGAWKRGIKGEQTLQVARFMPEETLRVIGSRSHGGEALSSWLQELGVPYSFLAAGSSLKFCRIAEGQADIYPRFGLTSQWDTAAAQCVLEVAGGAVMDLARTPLLYGLDREILNPHFLAIGDLRLVELIHT